MTNDIKVKLPTHNFDDSTQIGKYFKDVPEGTKLKCVIGASVSSYTVGKVYTVGKGSFGSSYIIEDDGVTSNITGISISEFTFVSDPDGWGPWITGSNYYNFNGFNCVNTQINGEQKHSLQKRTPVDVFQVFTSEDGTKWKVKIVKKDPGDLGVPDWTTAVKVA